MGYCHVGCPRTAAPPHIVHLSVCLLALFFLGRTGGFDKQGRSTGQVGSEMGHAPPLQAVAG